MNGETGKKDNELLRLGAKLTKAGISSGAGAIVGATAGGPVGAMIGGATGALIEEFSSRLLSRRQKMRVGAIMLYAEHKIEERIQNGDKPNESFFNNKKDRSNAEEIWEGLLTYAQQDYEEKKLPFYANLMVNIAFEKEFDKARAGFLLKLASNLSYRQLCLIAIFAGKEIKSKLRDKDYRGEGGSINQHLASILHEVKEMHSLDIVSIPNDTLLGITDVAPAKMHVQGAGVELGRLMELDKIPSEDLNRIAHALL